MPLDKTIIKAQVASASAFEYKPKEIRLEISEVAKSFAAEEGFSSKDFKIAELVAKQAGITQLESDAHQDRINTQVLERLKEVEERAYKEGYDLGLADGSEKAFENVKAELEERLAFLESILKDIERMKSRLVTENEGELVQLVYLIAKKIAMRDLEENREAVLGILQDVAGQFQADQKVVVHLAQSDLDFLKLAQEKSGQKLEVLESMKFNVNESVKPGGCIIETEYGSVDATIEERVERTWQALATRVPHNAPEGS